MAEVLPQRFMIKVSFTETCWLWTAGKRGAGYGSYKVNGKNIRAHRFVWERINGEIPDGLNVLHKCDNPSCVNPDHLFLGTQKENMIDMVQKGRSARGERNGKIKCPDSIARGELSGNAKLTQKQVDEIRKNYRRSQGVANEFSGESLSRMYGVSQQQISKIVNHKIWNVG